MQTEFAHHYYEYFKGEFDLIKITIYKEFKEICEKITSKNMTEKEWTEIESSDKYKTESYYGGFDITEMEFCFSFYDKNQEFWFQLSLADIKRVENGETKNLYARKAE